MDALSGNEFQCNSSQEVLVDLVHEGDYRPNTMNRTYENDNGGAPEFFIAVGFQDSPSLGIDSEELFSKQEHTAFAEKDISNADLQNDLDPNASIYDVINIANESEEKGRRSRKRRGRKGVTNKNVTHVRNGEIQYSSNNVDSQKYTVCADENVSNIDIKIELQSDLDPNTSKYDIINIPKQTEEKREKRRERKSGKNEGVADFTNGESQCSFNILNSLPEFRSDARLILSKSARRRRGRQIKLEKANEIGSDIYSNVNNCEEFSPSATDLQYCKNILELQNMLSSHHISPNVSENSTISPTQVKKIISPTKIKSVAQNCLPSPNQVKKCLPIVKTRKNKKYTFEDYLDGDEALKLLKNHQLIQGILRINPKNYQTAYVNSPNANEPDYLIDGIAHRNRALNGDIVLLSLEGMPLTVNNDGIVQKTGKVVFIKQKVHPRTSVGFLNLMADKNRKMAIFKPRDHRIPRMYIPFTCWPALFYEEHEKYSNVLFVAKIDKWIDVAFANGIITSNIGYCGELNVESKAILAENELDVTPFDSDLQQFYPRLDYVISQSEFQYRRDCRDMCVFTIDPLTARDLDDAISCKLLENGNLEVGVHIADVSFFLKEGTTLDEKVALKATTVYMVERAYHMLPEDLCLMCSLLPGCDKLAFSVFWEFNKNGEIKNQYFCRTVINSCTQLAYEHAQKIIENPDCNFSQDEFPKIYGQWTPGDISQTVKNLFSLSLILRNQRFDSGALKIDQPKLCFQLDPISGLPQSYAIYENKESHRLIEEFMLLANMTVAKQIYEDFPRLAFLRRHPSPNTYMLSELAKKLAPLGIWLDISSAGKLQNSLSHFTRPDLENDGMLLALNALVVKPMNRAVYFCADGCDDEDFSHYALNVPWYTHFTSPIRRYADIMVHRLLSASLGYSERPLWNVGDVHTIAENCNKQKYNAKRAGEMSSEMYIHMYISQNAPMIVKAVVVDVRMNYFDSIILDNGLAKRIHLNKCIGKATFIRNEENEKLNKICVNWPATDTLPETSQIIEFFSSVNVRLDKTDEPFKITCQLERPDNVI